MLHKPHWHVLDVLSHYLATAPHAEAFATLLAITRKLGVINPAYFNQLRVEICYRNTLSNAIGQPSGVISSTKVYIIYILFYLYYIRLLMLKLNVTFWLKQIMSGSLNCIIPFKTLNFYTLWWIIFQVVIWCLY